MAATWAVTLLLVGYLSVCDGDVCSARRKHNSDSYKSLYYMEYIHCSDGCCGSYTIRYCCRSTNFHWYHYLLVVFLVVLLCIGIALIVYGVKRRRRGRCMVRPRRRWRAATNSGVSSRRMASGDGEQPVNDYPFPPSYFPRDPPPPFDYSGQAHPPGHNSNGGQINTRMLPPGTIHPPPSMPPPAWQAPPPGSPPPSDHPPMPQLTPSQSHPHPAAPSLEAPPPNRPPVASPPAASSIHPQRITLPLTTKRLKGSESSDIRL